MVVEQLKSFTVWSEAQAIKQLCGWLAKKNSTWEYDWEAVADAILSDKQEIYRGKGDEKWWSTYGKGVFAVGDNHEECSWRHRIELEDVEKAYGHKVKVTFYVSFDDEIKR